MYAKLWVVAAFAIGCRAGESYEEAASLSKVVPRTVSLPAAWGLFDRSTSSGFVPSETPIELRLDHAAGISAFKLFGQAPYRLVVHGGGADGAVVASVDLTHLGTGWHSIETETLVTTDHVTLAFTQIGPTTAPIPELEIWEIADDATVGTGVAANDAWTFSADTEGDVIAAGNCATFAVTIDTSVMSPRGQDTRALGIRVVRAREFFSVTRRARALQDARRDARSASAS